MAHTAISAADAQTLRSNNHMITAVRLNVVAPQTVASLTVTAIPSTVPYVNLTVSGSMASVAVGQMVKVYSGSTLKTWGVVRKAPAGSTLYINPVSLGDPGAPQLIESAIAISDSVTVYSHHPMWALYSTIQQQQFYKQWDVPYSDQNSQPPPVANTGEWQAADITSGSATFTLPRDGTQTSFALGSATISSYLWTLPAGVSLVSGYATSDGVIQVTATPGQYLVKLTVTDSNSKTHDAYIWLFVHDGSTYTSFGHTYPWQITNDTQDMLGREMTIRVWGSDLDTTVILPGAGVLFNVDYSYDGSTVTDGVTVDTFCGYIVSVDSSHNGRYGYVDLAVKSPMKLAAENMVLPTQSMTEVSSPANWAEVTSALSNPRGAAYYNIKWHTPALLDMHDFDDGSLSTPRRLLYQFTGSSLGDALKSVGDSVLGNIGSASDGTTVFRKNPCYRNNTFRNAQATIFTWGVADLRDQLAYRRSMLMGIGETRGGAFAYDGTNTGAWMAIKRWYQGTRKTTIPNFMVTMAEGLSEVKNIIGHAHAYENNPDTITLPAAGFLDIVEPVYLQWHYLTVDSAYDPRGLGFSSTRTLPQRVTRQWDQERGISVKIAIDVKEETYGQQGEELPFDNAAYSLANGWAFNLPTPYQQAQDTIPGFVFPVNDVGQDARSTSFLDSSPRYMDWSNLIGDSVCSHCWDYASEFFANGYDLASKLGCFIAATDGVSLNIYYVDEVRETTPSFTLLKTYTMNDTSCDTTAMIQCSKTTPGFVAVCWHDQTGVLIGRSTDSGATWGSAVQVGATIGDATNDDAQMGFCIDGTNQLVIAPDSTVKYGLYLATTTGGSFSALTGVVRSTVIGQTVQVDASGNAYVAVPASVAPKSAITFDSAGDADYTVFSSSTDSGTINTSEETTGGNPDTCYHFNRTSGNPVATGTVRIGLYIDLGATYTVTAASCDFKFNSAYAGHKAISGDIYYYTYVPTTGLVRSTGVYSEYFDGATKNTWQSGSDSSFSQANVRYIVFQLHHDVEGSFGVPATTEVDYYFDNLSVTVSIGGSGTAVLYKVTDYAGSPTWNDVTPTGDYAPIYPYGLTVDLADDNNVELMAYNGSAYHWWSSADGASSWSDNGASDYRCVTRVGDVLLLGGDTALDLSVDGGASVSDKLGTLGVAWDTVSTVKQILTVL